MQHSIYVPLPKLWNASKINSLLQEAEPDRSENCVSSRFSGTPA
jgi:hypothetical protein